MKARINEKNRLLGNNCGTGCICKGNNCQGCDSGYYNDGNRNKIDCKECDKSCAECNGDNSDDCTSCKSGSVLINKECKKCDINNGYYISNSSCKSCDSNCKTCFSKSTTCTSCNNSYLIDQQKSCVNCVLSQGYFVSSTKICTKCHTTCATCSGQSDSECQSCPSGVIFQGSSGGIGKCLACDTTNGYYISNSQCVKCDSTCKTCNGTQASNCLSCYSNFYRRLNDNTCTPCDTKGGFFIDANNYCRPCSLFCKTCTDVTINACSACMSSYYLYLDGSCSTCTESDKFKDESTQKCVQCNPSCLTCSNATSTGCLTCQPNTYLYPDNSCKSCNSSTIGYYLEDPLCKACYSTCDQCINSQADQCTQCKTGYYKQAQQTAQAGPFSCIPCNVQLGQFLTSSSPPECSNCDSTCKTCSGVDNTMCNTCNDGLFFHQENLQKFCKPCDVSNKFFIDNGGNCLACHPSCLKCSTSDINGCTACQSGSYLKVPDNTCDQCNYDNYFISSTFCQKCDDTCKTCNGQQNNNCLTCNASNYLTKQSTCVTPCPDGTFQSNGKCELCDPSCATCSEATKCSTCPMNNTYLQRDLCLPCPDNYFGSSITNNCQQCDQTCFTCDSALNCTKCYGDLVLNSGVCPTPCGAGLVNKGGQCVSCDSSCSTCSDDTAFGCILCSQTGYTFLLNSATNQKSCVNCSGKDQFFQLGENCLPCAINCKTCNAMNDQNHCLSCMSGYYFKEENNSCVECKNEPNFYQTADMKCKRCPSFCNKCREDGANVLCDECQSPKVRSLDLKQCITCPIESYFEATDTGNAICKNCDVTCKKCNGVNDYNCTDCFVGKMLFQKEPNKNQCIVCGEGFIIDNNTCYACIDGCRLCSNRTECTTCKDSYFLFEDKTCKNLCDTSNGYFQFSDGISQCKKCSDNCLSCDSSTKCTKCNTNFSFQLNGDSSVSCINCLVSNQYFIDKDKFCKKCDNNCLTCDGPNPNQCKTCADPKKLYPDKSCGVCTIEYRIDGNNCVLCDTKCNGCDANGCIACASGYYFVGDTKNCDVCNIQKTKFINGLKCQDCHPKCLTCTSAQENACILCNSPLTKDTSGQCIKCDKTNGFFEDLNNNLCLPCSQNCKVCTGPENSDCTQCQSNLYIQQNTNNQSLNCEECHTVDRVYINNNLCSSCHTDCKTCDGGANNQCLSCPVGTFILGNDRRCQPCPNGDYDNLNNVTKFSQCQEYDIVCQKDTLTSKYTLQIKCKVCKLNYILQNEPNSCVTDCKEVGLNISYNKLTKQCECSSRTNYFNIAPDINGQKQLSFCTSEIADGYFCNSDRLCLQCETNCKVCSSHNECSVCQITHYLWFGECLPNCSGDKGLVEQNADETKKTNNICICQSGYVIRAQDKICVKKLKIDSVKLSIQNNNNLITIILNRQPYSDESEDLSVLVDPVSMTINKDYTIVNKSQIDNKISIEVNVTQNRKINEIIITLNKETHKLTLKNTILTTEDFNKDNKSTQQRSEDVNNVSQNLVPQSELAKNVMFILKNFQILCILSNFIQVLGPIVMFKESLPPQIFTYSIFGASFIFEKIPSYEELSYEMSSTSTTPTNTNQNKNKELSNKFRLLHSLGLEKPLYNNFVFPHLSLIIVSVIVFLNLFARAIMKGKQYTLQIVNILLNIMSNLNQSYITPAVFSIYFSISFEDSQSLAIFQSFIHVFFMSLIAYILCIKDKKYIEECIPNFFENIDFKAKGSKSYILISYAKKYFVIAIFLAESESAIISCVIISIAFFLHGLYILYYRFFQYKFISYFKVFQELFIGVTFVLLAISCKKLADILNKSTISNQDLFDLGNISLIVFYMLIICLVLSLILFIVRFLFSMYEIIQQLKLCLQKRKEKTDLDNQQRLLLLELVSESNHQSNASHRQAKFGTLKFLNHPKTPILKPNNSPNLTSRSETNDYL